MVFLESLHIIPLSQFAWYLRKSFLIDSSLVFPIDFWSHGFPLWTLDTEVGPLLELGHHQEVDSTTLTPPPRDGQAAFSHVFFPILLDLPVPSVFSMVGQSVLSGFYGRKPVNLRGWSECPDPSRFVNCWTCQYFVLPSVCPIDLRIATGTVVVSVLASILPVNVEGIKPIIYKDNDGTYSNQRHENK